MDDGGNLPAGGHLLLTPDIPDRPYHLHDCLHLGLDVLIHIAFLYGGPAGQHDGLTFVRKVLPDFLGNKGHKGMKQPQRSLQHLPQDVLGGPLCRLT